MKTVRSKALLASAIIGTILLVIKFSSLASYLSQSYTQRTSYQAGTMIGLTLMAPHLICFVVAIIFNWLAYFTNKKAFALTGAIAYSVAGVALFTTLLDVIPSVILSFVGYTKLTKIIEINSANQIASETATNNSDQSDSGAL